MAYINGNDDLKLIVASVEKSAGKIVITKTEIPPKIECVAVLEDHKGNHIALHSKE